MIKEIRTGVKIKKIKKNYKNYVHRAWSSYILCDKNRNIITTIN